MLYHPVGYYYSTGDWLWSIFSTALFIALFVAAIVLLVRLFAGPRHGRAGAGPAGRATAQPWYGPGAGWGGRGGWARGGAEQILAERYARGDISEEEYRERLEVLRQAGAGQGEHWRQPWSQPPVQAAEPAPQPPEQS